ncbi:LysR family transcriptional regulator substrate-binding protein [Nesterenkonia alkaliphila]|uniref:LysR family transcriptional regulator substrate-binding protein n=1 Tax=Nesterenkonia alkaliphila TaxID=1463631 RepID=UPI0012F8D5A4|nr:LysR family transcriptional regulator substrate-binding protein [Nesterenkonia alkaliphila]GFZ87709.1 hypothetical protein GCM10011359_16250 [Nesterenkonia alkaliphila]
MSFPGQLTLGAIPGAAPDKWVRRWRERFPAISLRVVYYDDAGAPERLIAGTVDISYHRSREGLQLPEEGLFHRVRLYTEQAVVCAARDHCVAAAEDSVDVAELFDEPFLDPRGMVSEPADPHRPLAGEELARAERIALEVVASGAGLLVMPHSVARSLSRKDVVTRVLDQAPGYDVSLLWLRERDSEQIQEFIGVARGRRAQSPRSAVSSADIQHSADVQHSADARRKEPARRPQARGGARGGQRQGGATRRRPRGGGRGGSGRR